MSAGAVITEAYRAMAGTTGAIALTLERKRPVSQAQIAAWVLALRAAADKLETLTGEKANE